MKRSTAAVLLAITVLAVAMRLVPLLRSLYWGADFGEYLALTRALVSDGFVPTAYDGWGVTYPSFPGLFFVNAAFVHAGMPIDLATSLLVPALAGLAVLPTFLVATRVTADDVAGLVAAAFVAVVFFHVYPTSHAIPAALGDVLLVGALLAFLGLRRSPKLFIPLVAMGLALVIVHHLTTYALLLLALAAVWFRTFLDRSLTVRTVRLELAFLAILFAAAVAYWVNARPFWALVETNVPGAPALLVAAAVAVASPPVAMALRRRSGWRYRPRTPSRRAATAAASLAAATCLGLAVIFVAFPVPGTSIQLEASYLPFLAPTLLFLTPAASGRRVLDFAREGSNVTAWFAAILLSIVVGAVAAPEVLVPYRHFEYLAIPLAVMTGAGIAWLAIRSNRAGVRPVVLAAAILLVAGTAAAAYPPRTALAGWDEGIDPRAVETGLWVRLHVDGLVAGDHRVSTVVFGFSGEDATWDRETRMWHTTGVDDALAAMESVRLVDSVARVDWVVLDADLRRGVQLSPFAPAEPLLPEEEAKFTALPFHKTFDSGYARAYYVNWGLVGRG